MSISHETVATSGPVIEYGVTPELNCSARYAGDIKSEFYGDTSCVTAIGLPSGVYAPSNIPAGSALTSGSSVFETEAQSRSGEGSGANPYAVTTIVRAEAIRLTQVDSYVAGDNRLRTHMTLQNTGPESVTFDVFRAGDCYARDSDYGYGQMGAQWAACVSQFEARTVRFLAEVNAAGQPEAGTWQGYYHHLWERIASYNPGGARLPFDGSCRCGESIDNAAGLKWTVTLAPGATQTIMSAIDFGAIANPGGFGQPSAVTAGGKPYVALGDSFSSGEGAGNPAPRTPADKRTFPGWNYNYYAETDRDGNRCHRSRNAYPVLIAERLRWLRGTTDLDFRACSGAVISDLINPNRDNEGEEPQIHAVGADTRLVTLTIGGNDANFAKIIKECVIPAGRACNTAMDNEVRDSYLALASNEPTATSLYQAYRNVTKRMSPGARLFVFGYPDFVPYASVGNSAGRCETALEFTKGESDWMSNWIQTFNGLIRHRAGRAGATFVDVDAVFQLPTAASHRICAESEWTNGIRRSGRKAASESFHPNKAGQQAFFNSVMTPLETWNVPHERNSNQARAHQGPIATPGPTTVVIRKGSPATTPVQVAAGHTTVLSLRYDGAAPRYTLTDPSGAEVPIGQIDDSSALLPQPAGANIARMDEISSLELRGLPEGAYVLSAQLEQDAPTDAGVLSVTTSSYAEQNLSPLSAMRVSVNRNRKLSFSAVGSFDPEGAPLAYRWTFGDRRSRAKVKSSYRYRKAGRYRVGLAVSDPSGGRSKSDVLVDTRVQKFASVRVVRSGRRAVVRVGCVKRLAVGGCQVRLRTVARTPGRKPVIRTKQITLARGKTAKQIVALPKAKRGKFIRVKATAVGTDGAIRPAKSRASAKLNLKR